MKTSIIRNAERELVCESSFVDRGLCDASGTIKLRKLRVSVIGFNSAPPVEMVSIIHQDSSGIRRRVRQSEPCRLCLEVSREVHGHLGIALLRERRYRKQRERRYKQTDLDSHFS